MANQEVFHSVPAGTLLRFRNPTSGPPAAAPRLQFSAGSEFRLLLPLRSVSTGTFPQTPTAWVDSSQSKVCFQPAVLAKANRGRSVRGSASSCRNSRDVPAGTLLHFVVASCALRIALRSVQNLRNVPAGTLDAFCTQIHRVHSKSSLHLKCFADYAAL
jgi:hypothetical protein